MIKKTIQKIFIFLLCLNLVACGGASFRGGIKFEKSVGAETNTGNPNHTIDVLKLNNGKYISFYRPIGKCGAGITFFGIILPIIPVWFHINTCNKELSIQNPSEIVSDLKLKYNGKIYDVAIVEKIEDPISRSHGRISYNTIYKFKIDSFSEFKKAKDKVLIVTLKDGFMQELPIKWGVMMYNNYALP